VEGRQGTLRNTDWDRVRHGVVVYELMRRLSEQLGSLWSLVVGLAEGRGLVMC
jgi:hypothetical protein